MCCKEIPWEPLRVGLTPSPSSYYPHTFSIEYDIHINIRLTISLRDLLYSGSLSGTLQVWALDTPCKDISNISKPNIKPHIPSSS
jgi:hypothetical protein